MVLTVRKDEIEKLSNILNIGTVEDRLKVLILLNNYRNEAAVKRSIKDNFIPSLANTLKMCMEKLNQYKKEIKVPSTVTSSAVDKNVEETMRFQMILDLTCKILISILRHSGN